jgi:hypothetical protein
MILKTKNVNTVPLDPPEPSCQCSLDFLVLVPHLSQKLVLLFCGPGKQKEGGKEAWLKPGIMAHACNSSIQEVEAERSRVTSQHCLHSGFQPGL